MLYNLLRLYLAQPQLLASHAQGYAELASAEVGVLSTLYQRRLWLNALALCGFVATAVLSGVALMLWSVTPEENIRSVWALFGAPLLPATAGLYCVFKTGEQPLSAPFNTLQQQVRADMATLRKGGAP